MPGRASRRAPPWRAERCGCAGSADPAARCRRRARARRRMRRAALDDGPVLDVDADALAPSPRAKGHDRTETWPRRSLPHNPSIGLDNNGALRDNPAEEDECGSIGCGSMRAWPRSIRAGRASGSSSAARSGPAAGASPLSARNATCRRTPTPPSASDATAVGSPPAWSTAIPTSSSAATARTSSSCA